MKKFDTSHIDQMKLGWLKLMGCILLSAWMYMPNGYAQWNQIGQSIDGEADEDYCGNSVALSGDGTTFALGAPLGNDAGGINRGHVRIFRYDCGMWTQLGTDIDGDSNGDIFGWALSLSADGTRLAIGAPKNDEAGTNAGKVKVFQWNGSAWTQMGSDLLAEAAADNYGYSVELSDDGSRLAVGGYLNDGSFPGAGHVRVFQWVSTAWVQLGADIDGEAMNNTSGEAVSLSGDGMTVAIGAIGNSGGGSFSGHVRVYTYSGGNWVQVGSDIDGEAPLQFSGKSVSLSQNGSCVAIGSPYNSNGSYNGYVKVYKNISGLWVQQGGKMEGDAPFDFSAISTSISANGQRVAIGAYQNDADGVDRGQIKVFQYNAGSWIQVGSSIVGIEDYESIGLSVSLSADGNKLATGAPYHSAVGLYRGQGRVYGIGGGGGSEDSDCDGVGNVCDLCPGGDDTIDNNEDGEPDCAVLPLYADIIPEWKCAPNKVMVAHEDNGVCYTLCLSYNAAQAHLNHGDYLGPCHAASCNESYSVPDSKTNVVEGNGLVVESLLPDMDRTEPKALSVLPTVVKDEMIIGFPASDVQGELILFNAHGNPIWIHTIQPGEERVLLHRQDVPALYSPGMYFTTLHRNGRTAVKSFVITE